MVDTGQVAAIRAKIQTALELTGRAEVYVNDEPVFVVAKVAVESDFYDKPLSDLMVPKDV